MSRNIRVLGLCILAVLAVSAVSSASASAAVTCYRVAVPKTGTFSNEECTEAGGTNEYIKAELATRITAREWCAKVAKPTGKYSNNACTEEKTGATEKEYIKVLLPCYKVAEKGTGNRDTTCVTNAGPTAKEYVDVSKLETQLRSGEWCAKVSEPKTGNYEDNGCTKKVAEKEYIKVLVPEFTVCSQVKAGEPSEWEAGCKVKKAGGGSAKVVPGPGECVKVVAGEPSAWEAGCTVKKVGGGWIKETPAKLTFTDKEGVSHLYGTAGVVYTCQKDTSKGEITGPTTTVGDTVTFTECTAKEGEKAGCSAKSPGEPAGTIKTKLLRDTLNSVEKPEATSEVGESLEPEGKEGFVTLEAECLSIKKTQVSGSVIGEVTPINVMQTTGELIFACEPAKSTKQKIKFSEAIKDVLSVFAFESCFESKAEITFAEPIEVEYP